MRKSEFNVVKCVTSGNGFKKGNYYAQIGWNNGVGIQRLSENGDCITELFMTGGIGEGLFNSWDDTGCPSFDPVSFAVDCGDIKTTELRF